MEDDQAKKSLPLRSGSGRDYLSIQKENEASNVSDMKQEGKAMSFQMCTIKTIAMGTVYAAMGCYVGVQGPSMLDIAALLSDGNVEVLSRASSMFAVGIMCGSAFGAVISDRFRNKADLLLFVMILSGALLGASVPWLQSVPLFGLVNFCLGLIQGTTSVACSALVIAMWGVKAAAPLHCLHACYCLGVTLAQPITGHFIANELLSTAANVSLDNKFKMGHAESTVRNGTQVYIPYIIFGIYELLVSFSFLAFFLAGSVYTSATIRSNKSVREMLSPSSCTGGRGWYGCFILVSLLFLFTGFVFREFMFLQYICPIGTLVFNLVGHKASLLSLAYNICFLVGRVGGAVLAMFLRIQIIVCVEFMASIIFSIALSVAGFDAEIFFWFLVCGFGFFLGPTYSSVMAWTDRYIEATGFVVAVMEVGIGLGSFSAVYIGGYVLQRVGAQWLFYISAGFAVCSLVLFVPMQLLSTKYGDRHALSKLPENDTNPLVMSSNTDQNDINEGHHFEQEYQ